MFSFCVSWMFIRNLFFPIRNFKGLIIQSTHVKEPIKSFFRGRASKSLERRENGHIWDSVFALARFVALKTLSYLHFEIITDGLRTVEMPQGYQLFALLFCRICIVNHHRMTSPKRFLNQ